MYSYYRKASDKIWIFVESKYKFMEIDRNDPRLDWNYPHSPERMIRFSIRRDFEYVYWGETKQQVADHYNLRRLKEIENLEKRIDEIKSKLLKP